MFSLFSILFRHWFLHRFLIAFLMENYPKWLPILLDALALLAPVGDLFRTSSFKCILVAIWLPFGSLLAPPGSFWTHLVAFWSTFGSFWEHFGAFWTYFQSKIISLGNQLAKHPQITAETTDEETFPSHAHPTYQARCGILRLAT